MIKRHYFISGQTAVKSGMNRTFHLQFWVRSFLARDPSNLMAEVREMKANELETTVDDILITSFNRI